MTDLIRAHRHSIKHMEEVQASTMCGCFYCLKKFTPSEINDWLESEETALCPYCSIDAVIGDKSGYAITDTFLSSMREMWFVASDALDQVNASEGGCR